MFLVVAFNFPCSIFVLNFSDWYCQCLAWKISKQRGFRKQFIGRSQFISKFIFRDINNILQGLGRNYFSDTVTFKVYVFAISGHRSDVNSENSFRNNQKKVIAAQSAEVVKYADTHPLPNKSWICVVTEQKVMEWEITKTEVGN